MSLSIPTQLSFSKTPSSPNPLFLYKFSNLSLSTPPIQRKTTIIRMGGGPRTFPGGVSKWQWKRMQAKKAKQLLKARLARERQIYEMRKRAELKAAISELERPWEVVERVPTLFSVKADEQVKVLADRFQKPGGFDMWSDRDGPQLFQTPDGLPSARFFPKGVVHSTRPYGKISGLADLDDEKTDFPSENASESENLTMNSSNREMARVGHNTNENSDSESGYAKSSDGKWGVDTKSRGRKGGQFRRQGNRSRYRSGLGSLNSEQMGLGRKQRGGDGALTRGGGDTKTNRIKINNRNGWDNGDGKGIRNSRYRESEVFDMSLQQDGSYGFQAKNLQLSSHSRAPEALESF